MKGLESFSMPRGEHFKKENPRINQVSFKVNDAELKLLNELAKREKISVAHWLRARINGASNDGFATPVPSAQKEKIPKASKPKVEKVLKSKKPKDYDNDSQNEQMSLF